MALSHNKPCIVRGLVTFICKDYSMINYKGHTIYKADNNASGVKYYARTCNGILRADTLKGMKAIISKA